MVEQHNRAANDPRREVRSGSTTGTCVRHPSHVLTQVHRPPVHWSFCGLCEAERTRKFIDGMRDPDMKERFERAICG